MRTIFALFAVIQQSCASQISASDLSQSRTLAQVQHIWTSLPLALQIVLSLAILVTFSIAFTQLYTTLRYRRALARFLDPTSKNGAPLTPPPIPYTIPFLGSAQRFLAPKSGLFWDWLFSFHSQEAGCCTVQLGPRTAHILHNPASVQALFKSKNVDRLQFNIDIARRSLKVPQQDLEKYHGIDKRDKKVAVPIGQEDPEHMAERVNLDTLLKTEAVNELTAEFVRQLKLQLRDVDTSGDLELSVWLRKHMFEASGKALMGEKIFEYFPAFGERFWDFERSMLSLFFGIPEFMLPEQVRARDRAIDGFVQWHDGLERDGLDTVVDSTGSVPWEPNYGSRANRARQEMYGKFGLSRKARAGFDLGFTFGLASNAIPATGWMLLHILDPNADKTLLPRVMAELQSARSTDGNLNLPALFALPLFQSIFHEVLRLYTDVLVTRSLHENLVLPLSGPTSKQIVLQKGDLAIAPCWIGHRDSSLWTEPTWEVFYPERFLTTDPDTGKDVFSLTGTAGRFFPFGGGKTICPGRVFAKQEVLAATALMLLEFEFDVKGFTTADGRDTERFPGLRDGLGGSGVILQEGDLKLGLKRR